MYITVFQPKYIASEMKRADLAATICKQFVASRCAGSNLARMELTVALETWLARIPEFRLAEGAEVTWAGGQVRGPRTLPVVFP